MFYPPPLLHFLYSIRVRVSVSANRLSSAGFAMSPSPRIDAHVSFSERMPRVQAVFMLWPLCLSFGRDSKAPYRLVRTGRVSRFGTVPVPSKTTKNLCIRVGGDGWLRLLFAFQGIALALIDCTTEKSTAESKRIMDEDR